MSLNSYDCTHCLKIKYRRVPFNYGLYFKQYQILESILVKKRDTIGILPTGYGKSVIFHILPYVADYLNTSIHVRKGNTTTHGNIVLVITPVNALIDNQITILQEQGVQAAILKTVSKSHSKKESDVECNAEAATTDICEDNVHVAELSVNSTTKENIKEGMFKILFAHPEAFISCKEGRRLLLSKVLQQNVIACVIDEGHLVEEWGVEFRKDFAKLFQLGLLFPAAPLLVLTATAPKHVIEALKNTLVLSKPKVVVANLDRSNIFISKEKRLPSSTDILREKNYFPPGDKKPENCLFAQFHAPQTEQMKNEILKQLQGPNESRSIRVIFATVAIGIGVNILDVRHVVHISVPGTIESYYQEIGSAGRDGKPAKASLYYNGHDISHSKPGMTTAMRDFCSQEDVCLRKIVLDYLGSPAPLASKDKCIQQHSCCINCSRMCMCLNCKQDPVELPYGFQEHEPKPLLRSVSDAQRGKIRKQMKDYRLKLGKTGCRIGSIDTRTGVTLELIESIVSECDNVKSAEEMYSRFEIWDIEHAHSFFEIIENICENKLLLYSIKMITGTVTLELTQNHLLVLY
ncbi:uncharacterized protein LOC114531216 [Dendronephthya gigantea]|uniref:uncharacterized protein LOC114531216 n=1 Tax=Dendronephthya gigantea TaxID=151771 RepID=UPI00106B2482|nr:uncharacterized protein LOC114531216 [Dendronephthya gigantea]